MQAGGLIHKCPEGCDKARNDLFLRTGAQASLRGFASIVVAAALLVSRRRISDVRCCAARHQKRS
jgi:hypothetical protein